MADYKELLRRAISALPENNGAARRAVYEKARSALVGQLRAITPPLPARDITQHRLQLEDCIRQVEQEASEAVISLGREAAAARPAYEAPPRPAPVPPPQAKAPEPTTPPEPAKPAKPADKPKSFEVPKPVVKPFEASKPAPAQSKAGMSIEDIIAEAAATTGADVSEVADKAPVAPARPASPSSRPAAPSVVPVSNVRSIETPLKSPSLEPRRDAAPLAANSTIEPIRSPMRVEPTMGNQALARQTVAVPVEAALSSVREVELEAVQPDMNEAQGAIERAIETLDREARGEPTAPLLEPALAADAGAFGIARPDDDASGFVQDAPAATRSGAGLTIFLIVFAILLAGVGGAGFWAWREGYVDLDQMFGQAQPAVADATTPTPTTPTMDPVVVDTPAVTEVPVGPGNTATTTTEEPTVALEGVEIDDRLEPTPEPVVPTGSETVLPSLGGEEVKTEERLTDESAVAATDITDPAASVDPAVLAGSQSLLLEASQDGRTGAVPFSGTVEWSEGTDELGLPTLIGRASIPARSLGVNLTIRKNSDPSLPASHLMEVDFEVSDTFIGGAIANLPGVLLKDEELVPGTPLVGASARVVGNSFLFALSASDVDAAVNADLLENRKWMDLAVVYGTGRNAILTLEKDDTAQALFEKVFTTWAQ